MKHRIFLGINLPEDIRKRLVIRQRKINELFAPEIGEDFSSVTPIRWTKPANLHITLVFLGYLSDDEVGEICIIANEIISKHQAFSIKLTDILYGPPGKMPPRMIWLKGESSKELTALRNDLENILFTGGFGLQSEKREFSPHITLGRISAFEWRKINPEEMPQVEEKVNLNFSVNSIEIMERVLKKGGPNYAIMESILLAD
ncbi:MAG: RNA 2',3'-cyclic phosphodiesterase [Candidatus Parcubacteria bacterium]|nr:RNA 2',3'-cyclic phosphodiesterase [Candidatus Parcubacteria bacterium]